MSSTKRGKGGGQGTSGRPKRRPRSQKDEAVDGSQERPDAGQRPRNAEAVPTSGQRGTHGRGSGGPQGTLIRSKSCGSK